MKAAEELFTGSSQPEMCHMYYLLKVKYVSWTHTAKQLGN